MRLYSVTDAAGVLEVSRQRVYELWQYGKLPAPLGFTSAGAIWKADDIDTYAAGRNRKSGRPRKDTTTPC